MFKKAILMGSAAALTLGTGAAMAATSATATTDLNLRMGPGPAYQIAGVISADDAVSVDGCVADGAWCKVSYNGTEGWAYGNYLMHEAAPIVEAPTVSVIQYEETQEAPGAAMIGSATGATVGALVGGPVGAVIGGVVGGAVTGEAAEVTEETTVYVRENPVEPVFLDGEVVVGAAVPNTVQYYTIPSSDQYAYTNVNGNTVIVDEQSGAIVQIIR